MISEWFKFCKCLETGGGSCFDVLCCDIYSSSRVLPPAAFMCSTGAGEGDGLGLGCFLFCGRISC